MLFEELVAHMQGPEYKTMIAGFNPELISRNLTTIAGLRLQLERLRPNPVGLIFYQRPNLQVLSFEKMAVDVNASIAYLEGLEYPTHPDAVE